jgi:predicted nucleic acid-binding protein
MLALRKGDESAAMLVERAGRRSLSVITYMDMLAASTTFKESFVIEAFIQGNGFEVVPISEPISRRAALYMEYYGVARGLSPRSALIGATAYEERLVLVSRPGDFGKLPELEIVPLLAHGKG